MKTHDHMAAYNRRPHPGAGDHALSAAGLQRHLLAHAHAAFGGTTLAFVSFALGIGLLLLAVLVFASVDWILKPVATLLVLISGISSYFNDTFGTVIDRAMIESAVTTTVRKPAISSRRPS